jgi:uncharacterized membrane protein
MSFSIIGFIIETILTIFTMKNFNSGVLQGPWTPLYGIVIFIILILNKIMKKFNLNKKTEIFFYFLIITIIMTGLELGIGHLIEAISGNIYWNYERIPLNFGHYISLPTSLAWGFGATILNYWAYPRIEKWIKAIPIYTTITITILFLIDIFLKIVK